MSEIPEVWIAGMGNTLDAIINKEVFEALTEYWGSVFAVYGMTKGRAELWVGMGDSMERKFDLEEIYLSMDGSEMRPDDYKLFAASFQRIADHMVSLSKLPNTPVSG